MRRTTIILLFLLNVLTSVWAARSVDWSKRIVPKSCEADAVLAASVFHYGELTIRQVKEYMRSQGIPVRL